MNTEQSRARCMLPNVTEEQLIARRPAQPPYLSLGNATAPISIDYGRNLFVDDFLVEWTNATRVFHQAIHRSVVLWPSAEEKLVADIEQNASGVPRSLRVHSARPFGGGVFFDDVRHRFVMHYRCLWLLSHARGRGCVAYSDDGVRWSRPQLDSNEALPNGHAHVTGGDCDGGKHQPRGSLGAAPSAPQLPNELRMSAPAWMLGGGARHPSPRTRAGVNASSSSDASVAVETPVGSSSSDATGGFGPLCFKAVPGFASTESFTVWLDVRPGTPSSERWKGLVRYPDARKKTPTPQLLWVSADGE